MDWFTGSSTSHRSHGGSKRHSSGGASVFGHGDDKQSSRGHNASRSSFLNFVAGGGSGSSSSYYKRSPRKGYVNRMMRKLQRLWRDFVYYAKNNPAKLFMLVIMPLITGGLLTGLLARFGIRLPPSIVRLLQQFGGGSSGFRGGDAGRGRRGEYQFERKSYEGPLGGIGNIIGAVGGLGGLGTAVSVAKMFM